MLSDACLFDHTADRGYSVKKFEFNSPPAKTLTAKPSSGLGQGKPRRRRKVRYASQYLLIVALPREMLTACACTIIYEQIIPFRPAGGLCKVCVS